MNFTATFRSARDAVRAERLCAAAGMTVAVVPPPTDISSECGMALAIADRDRLIFMELMQTNDIDATIHC